MRLSTYIIIGAVILLASGLLSYSFYVEQHENANVMACKYFGGHPTVTYSYILFVFKQGGMTHCDVNNEQLDALASLQAVMDYPSSVALACTFFLDAVMFGLMILGLREVGKNGY